jgi:hypothetical protein
MKEINTVAAARAASESAARRLGDDRLRSVQLKMDAQITAEKSTAKLVNERLAKARASFMQTSSENQAYADEAFIKIAEGAKARLQEEAAERCEFTKNKMKYSEENVRFRVFWSQG